MKFGQKFRNSDKKLLYLKEYPSSIYYLFLNVHKYVNRIFVYILFLLWQRKERLLDKKFFSSLILPNLLFMLTTEENIKRELRILPKKKMEKISSKE